MKKQWHSRITNQATIQHNDPQLPFYQCHHKQNNFFKSSIQHLKLYVNTMFAVRKWICAATAYLIHPRRRSTSEFRREVNYLAFIMRISSFLDSSICLGCCGINDCAAHSLQRPHLICCPLVSVYAIQQVAFPSQIIYVPSGPSLWAWWLFVHQCFTIIHVLWHFWIQILKKCRCSWLVTLSHFKFNSTWLRCHQKLLYNFSPLFRCICSRCAQTRPFSVDDCLWPHPLHIWGTVWLYWLCFSCKFC